MPISQGLHGGYMPGMTLRAWALVDGGGNLIKGNGVSAAVRNMTGVYKITLIGAAPAVTVLARGTAKNTAPTMLCHTSTTGNDITYSTKAIDGGLAADCLTLIEVYE